ncbi:WbqC family protein, partial [Saprospiraceae bacterium]|nr:WbqC family protein [Saprospiraceae bacterium]
SKPQLLFDFNVKIHEFILKTIGLDSISHTSQYDKSGHIYRPKFTQQNQQTEIRIPEYTQVFTEKYGFTPNLSILDLIFNVGPESMRILQASKVIFH